SGRTAPRGRRRSSLPPASRPRDPGATADRRRTARAPRTALPPCRLLEQPVALLVGQHAVGALRRLEQRAARRLVLRIVAVGLEPILHVGEPRQRRDLDLLLEPEFLRRLRAVYAIGEPGVTLLLGLNDGR